ncbi:MAG: DUF4922 domain-containing protein [Melioribacter sp.]|uniref:DUF4922 domain-containing protein n=1 Tax=Rosettibacter primus TaxID=3111523 RepID=UPI00247D196D|nr:DUF4922 domain-containing protein [Melioribacter sp.]
MIIEEKIPKNQSKEFWSTRILQLFEEQKLNWELLKNNYDNLKNIKVREFEFDDSITSIKFKVIVQYNPVRIKSTAADVSSEAILKRKCFLCIENLPEEQNGIVYNKHFVILLNPYPIFNKHLTITKKKHTPQTIISHFHDLLDLTEDLSHDFTIIYNGPKCGASAPDHMHFQAIEKNIIPLEKDNELIKRNSICLENEKIKIFFFENYLRKFISFESKNKGELLYAFKVFFNAIKKISVPKEEPMINLISSYQDEKWRLFIFPRLNHRPKQYFLEGSKKLLISPAAVDLGGILITVREEDFNKINKEDIIDIYKQVTFTKEYFEYLKKKLSDVYKS